MRLKSFFSEFKTAISFLSRIRIDGDEEISKISKVPMYFSLVGYLPGAFYFLFKILIPTFWGSILAMTIGFYFFDLFHFDGFLDSMDGFLSQKMPSKKMEIMSKGDVGPSALLYGMLFVIAYVTLFWKTKAVAMFYMAVFGRITMNFLLNFSKPAKKSGLGNVFYPYDHMNTFFSLAFTLPLIVHPKMFFISLISSLVVATTCALVSNVEINGYTGDVIGCANMISQLLILFGIYILKG